MTITQSLTYLSQIVTWAIQVQHGLSRLGELRCAGEGNGGDYSMVPSEQHVNWNSSVRGLVSHLMV